MSKSHVTKSDNGIDYFYFMDVMPWMQIKVEIFAFRTVVEFLILPRELDAYHSLNAIIRQNFHLKF